MTVPSDRPYRRPSERRGLVEAIHAERPSSQETDWLEWKSTLDLTIKRDRANLARHIIAFANRTVQAAQRNCSGFAYLVVGVEPEQVHGLDVVDSADLDQWLEPYLGQGDDAPQWSPEWVRWDDGHHVLVVEVDPPSPGMTIFSAHRSMEDVITEGIAYVRRQGRSVPAGPADLRALADRARSAGVTEALAVDLDLVGRPVGQRVPVLSYDEAADGEVLQAIRDEADGWQPVGGLAGYMAPSPEQLREWADGLQALALPRAAALASQTLGATLHLELVNPTDRPLRGLRVDAHVAGAMVLEDPNPPEPPQRPDRVGLSIDPSAFSSFPDVKPAGPTPGVDVDYSDGISHITWHTIDLHPRGRTPLDPVWIVGVHGQVQVGESLTIGWSAAAMNAHGRSDGVLRLPLESHPLRIAGLPSSLIRSGDSS